MYRTRTVRYTNECPWWRLPVGCSSPTARASRLAPAAGVCCALHSAPKVRSAERVAAASPVERMLGQVSTAHWKRLFSRRHHIFEVLFPQPRLHPIQPTLPYLPTIYHITITVVATPANLPPSNHADSAKRNSTRCTTSRLHHSRANYTVARSNSDQRLGRLCPLPSQSARLHPTLRYLLEHHRRH